jgi:hypothetical protein
MGLFFDENGKVLPEYARPWWETKQAREEQARLRYQAGRHPQQPHRLLLTRRRFPFLIWDNPNPPNSGGRRHEGHRM